MKIYDVGTGYSLEALVYLNIEAPEHFSMKTYFVGTH